MLGYLAVGTVCFVGGFVMAVLCVMAGKADDRRAQLESRMPWLDK